MIGTENILDLLFRVRLAKLLIDGRGPAFVLKTITGDLPLSFDAIQKEIPRFVRYGKVAQNGTPTPDAPVWPVINNGTVRMARPSGLPVRYQMVEWLTVTSPSKRITITDFKTKGTQEFECKWYRSAQINCYLYASDASSSLTTNTTAYLATASGNWRFDGRAAGFSAPVKTICTSIQNKAGAWINGSKVGSYGEADDFVSTNDLCILNGADSANVRFYYLKVRENDNLALDLVPVRDNMDGVYGVYDKISGEFYTNAEATFSAGADVEDTPYLTIDGTPEVLTVAGQTATVPDLYAVGDYKDEADIISGVVTRNVGMKVLDGTESWALNGTMRYVLTISGMAVLSGRTEGLCTHFNYARSSANEGTYFLTSARRLFVHTDFPTVADFKAWLADQYAQGTPVIVLYPLATETTESVDPQALATGNGPNTASSTAPQASAEIDYYAAE